MIYFALYNVLLCILDIIMICLILHQLGRKHVWSPGRGNKKGSSSQMQQGFLGIKYFVIGAKGCVQHWILIWSWIWLHSWPVCMIPTAFCLVQSPKRIKQEKLSLPYFRPFFHLYCSGHSSIIIRFLLLYCIQNVARQSSNGLKCTHQDIRVITLALGGH